MCCAELLIPHTHTYTQTGDGRATGFTHSPVTLRDRAHWVVVEHLLYLYMWHSAQDQDWDFLYW